MSVGQWLRAALPLVSTACGIYALFAVGSDAAVRWLILANVQLLVLRQEKQ